MAKPGRLFAVVAAMGAVAVMIPAHEADARGFGGGFRGGGGFHGHVGGFGHGHQGHGHHGHRHQGYQGHGVQGHGHGHNHHGQDRHGHLDRQGLHDHGRNFGRDGRRFGAGGVPWGIDNYGDDGPGGYDDRPRARREPSYGIPPSPVLPPAIYVIGPKGGTATRGGGATGRGRGSGPAIRKGAANPILTTGPGPGGSSATVIERRHRMN